MIKYCCDICEQVIDYPSVNGTEVKLPYWGEIEARNGVTVIAKFPQLETRDFLLCIKCKILLADTIEELLENNRKKDKNVPNL